MLATRYHCTSANAQIMQDASLGAPALLPVRLARRDIVNTLDLESGLVVPFCLMQETQPSLKRAPRLVARVSCRLSVCRNPLRQ